MPTVIVKPLVKEKTNLLFETLLEEDYFSDENNALAYCNAIEYFISSLFTHKRFTTTDNRYGCYYAVYKANRHTSWFILFDEENDVYLVRNIFNNHTEEYPRFIPFEQ